MIVHVRGPGKVDRAGDVNHNELGHSLNFYLSDKLGRARKRVGYLKSKNII